MKILKKVIITILSIAVLMVIFNSNAFAVGSVTINTTDNTPYKLTVTRNIRNVTNNVTNTFTYTVTPDSGNPTGATGEPTTFSVVYNNKAPNASYTATQTGDLSFVGATYTKIGDYKYTVKETASTDASTYPIVNTQYEVYVSVRYEVNGSGVQTGNLVATLAAQVIDKGNVAAGKQDMTYPSNTNFTAITVTNNVTGNTADQNEYFKFLVTVNGTTGDKYAISGQDTSVTYNGSTITPSTEYTVGGGAQYIYLKHGQTAVIGLYSTLSGTLPQIKVGVTYQLVEQDATSYETYINGSTTNSKNSGTLTTTSTPADNKIEVVNHKEDAVLTGVFFDIAPYCVLLLVAVAGIIVFVKTKQKNKEN